MPGLPRKKSSHVAFILVCSMHRYICMQYITDDFGRYLYIMCYNRLWDSVKESFLQLQVHFLPQEMNRSCFLIDEHWWYLFYSCKCNYKNVNIPDSSFQSILHWVHLSYMHVIYFYFIFHCHAITLISRMFLYMPSAYTHVHVLPFAGLKSISV